MDDRTPDFMLEEYKQIANGYQDLHAQQNELIKFYLTLVAVPASVLAIAAQIMGQTTNQTPTTQVPQNPITTISASATQVATRIANATPTLVILNTPSSSVVATPIMNSISKIGIPIIAALMIALCVIGFSVAMSLIATRVEALSYVKTVNLIRRYFVEHDPDGRLNNYLLMPDFDKFPHYWEGFTSRAFWNVLLVESLNSAIVFITVLILTYQNHQYIWISLGIAICSLIIQDAAHQILLRNRDKKYNPKFIKSFPVKEKIIGIDLDGVLGNLVESVIETAKNKYGIEIRPEQITSYRLQECTSLSEAQVIEIFQSTQVFSDMKPIPDAKEALKKLHKQNWIIHIITDRFWSKTDWSIAKAWLKENEIEWDYLNLVRAEEKADYAKAHGIRIFIEDNYETVINLSPVCTKVYLYNWPYNQGNLRENIKRVFNWAEIIQDL